jgi:hypothetical protein
MVMLFGLTNAPATIQAMMNHILKDLLNEGVIVYIDEVLIYAKIEEKYGLLVKQVLKRLAENDLVISLEKCEWSSERVEFLGYVIRPDRTEMGEDNIEAIKEWQAPRSRRDVQSFLRFANFYRRLIKDFFKDFSTLNRINKRGEKGLALGA